jgi:hypothetical protein
MSSNKCINGGRCGGGGGWDSVTRGWQRGLLVFTQSMYTCITTLNIHDCMAMAVWTVLERTLRKQCNPLPWQQKLLHIIIQTKHRHMIWLLPYPLPPSPVSKLGTGWLRKRDNLLTGEGGKGGGKKSYDGEKAWSSMNRSVLSDLHDLIAPLSNKKKWLTKCQNGMHWINIFFTGGNKEMVTTWQGHGPGQDLGQG